APRPPAGPSPDRRTGPRGRPWRRASRGPGRRGADGPSPRRPGPRRRPGGGRLPPSATDRVAPGSAWPSKSSLESDRPRGGATRVPRVAHGDGVVLRRGRAVAPPLHPGCGAGNVATRVGEPISRAVESGRSAWRGRPRPETGLLRRLLGGHGLSLGGDSPTAGVPLSQVGSRIPGDGRRRERRRARRRREETMRAGDVMTADVVTVGPEAWVGEIARLLLEHRISAVPVVDAAGRLVGIVSEGDLVRRAETGTLPRRAWWLDLLTDPAVEAREYVKTHGRRAA